jgi:hypothetical protein
LFFLFSLSLVLSFDSFTSLLFLLNTNSDLLPLFSI